MTEEEVIQKLEEALQFVIKRYPFVVERYNISATWHPDEGVYFTVDHVCHIRSRYGLMDLELLNERLS